jgi:hypothetical protein
MAQATKPIVNVADLPLDASSQGTGFAAETAEIGGALGLKGLRAMLHGEDD